MEGPLRAVLNDGFRKAKFNGVLPFCLDKVGGRPQYDIRLLSEGSSS